MGFLFVMIAHLFRVELIQFRSSGALNYILDPSNWIDIAHLSLSIGLILINFIASTNHYYEFTSAHSHHDDIDGIFRETWSVFVILFIWLKLFDWMRLHDGKAFFVRLLIETCYGIRHFMIVILIVFSGFGAIFYVISM